jgi:hypothetical protein
MDEDTEQEKGEDEAQQYKDENEEDKNEDENGSSERLSDFNLSSSGEDDRAPVINLCKRKKRKVADRPVSHAVLRPPVPPPVRATTLRARDTASATATRTSPCPRCLCAPPCGRQVHIADGVLLFCLPSTHADVVLSL